MGATVGIIGAAGTLGSCSAFALAERGVAGELRLFDVNRNLLLSHALDLQTGAAVSGGTAIRAAESLDELTGCDVVVMAAGAPWRQVSSRMELLHDSLRVVHTIADALARRCPNAVVITATNPVDPLNHALHLLTGMGRSQLVGYSLNDSFRLRVLAARALGVEATRVGGFVLGEHGEHQVPLFSTLTVDGAPTAVTPALREHVLAEIPKILKAFEGLGTGRTSGWTSAVGLAAMVQAVVQDSGALFPGSAILEGEYGRSGFSAGVPVRLGRGGVVRIEEWELPGDERTQLNAAFDYLEGNAARLRLEGTQ